MGAALFKQTFGANAYGKCVSLAMRSANANLQNSAEACNAEQADASFAASHQGKTFDAFYGANGKGKGSASNAFGKCVSGKAQAKTQQQTQAAVAAAKSCKAALLASKAAFATAWGTGSNAFGKCVSTKAKA
jgi:hypothetical protein